MLEIGYTTRIGVSASSGFSYGYVRVEYQSVKERFLFYDVNL